MLKSFLLLLKSFHTSVCGECLAAYFVFPSSRTSALTCGTCSCRRPDPPHVAGGTAVAPPLPPLPLTSKKESQAYQRELHTVTVGAHMQSSFVSPIGPAPWYRISLCSVPVSGCTSDALGVLRAAHMCQPGDLRGKADHVLCIGQQVRPQSLLLLLHVLLEAAKSACAMAWAAAVAAVPCAVQIGLGGRRLSDQPTAVAAVLSAGKLLGVPDKLCAVQCHAGRDCALGGRHLQPGAWLVLRNAPRLLCTACVSEPVPVCAVCHYTPPRLSLALCVGARLQVQCTDCVFDPGITFCSIMDIS